MTLGAAGRSSLESQSARGVFAAGGFSKIPDKEDWATFLDQRWSLQVQGFTIQVCENPGHVYFLAATFHAQRLLRALLKPS